MRVFRHQALERFHLLQQATSFEVGFQDADETDHLGQLGSWLAAATRPQVLCPQGHSPRSPTQVLRTPQRKPDAAKTLKLTIHLPAG